MRDITKYESELRVLLEYALNLYSRRSLRSSNTLVHKGQDKTWFGDLGVKSTRYFEAEKHLFYRRFNICARNGDALFSFILGASDMLYYRASKHFREDLINHAHIKAVATINRRLFDSFPIYSSIIIMDDYSIGTWFSSVDTLDELISLFCGELTTDSKTFFSETISPYNWLPEYYNGSMRITEDTMRDSSIKGLGEVAEIIAPKGASKEEYKTQGIPYLRGRDIKDGKICETDAFIDSKDIAKYSRNLLQAGDILLTKHFGQDKIALVTEDDIPAMASNMLFIIRPYELSEKYLYRYLSSKTGNKAFKAQLKSIHRGSTIPSITLTDLKGIAIPVLDDDTMQVLENLDFASKDETIKSSVRLLHYSQKCNEQVLEQTVMNALVDAGWKKSSFLFESDLGLVSDGERIRWRPDISYRLSDGRKVLVEIKTDLSKVSQEWVSAINRILHGKENFIFVLTTGYYYEVHISGIERSLKSTNPPTIERILEWESEVR